MSLPLHSEIDPKYTWNAPSLFASQADWGKACDQMADGLASLGRYQGRLSEGPATLLAAFEARDELLGRIGKVLTYAHMSRAVDNTDQAATAMSSKATGLHSQVLAGQSFIEPELIALGQATLRRWQTEEPRLAIFQHYFDNLFRKQAHIRTAETEELLGLLADPFRSTSATASLLTNADFKFAPARASDGAEAPITPSTYLRLLDDPDREMRRTAWLSYTDAFLAHKNTLANNLVTSIKQNIFTMRARRHRSTLEAALFEDNIPTAVFHNLIDTFRKHLPTWHRYWAVRRKALGVERLQYYDVRAPLTSQHPHITYEQAVDWIGQALAPLGDDYVSVLRRGCLEDRWVDVFPCQGKSAGAFSGGWKGTLPFIMLSFGGNIFGLSTLAHELGHSMHSYLTWQTQPMVYMDYANFVAEVASNFHQAMVRAYLLEHNADRDFQINLLEEAMANFFRYFFTMPTLARFELEIHQRLERGEGVTADTMIDLMADLLSEGYGGELELDHDRHGISWASYSHLYADYYVFQYATGISGANALARRILGGVPGAAGDYLRFLKAGASVYPLDALKTAGVDLTTPEPVEAAFEVLSGMVDRLAQLLDV